MTLIQYFDFSHLLNDESTKLSASELEDLYCNSSEVFYWLLIKIVPNLISKTIVKNDIQYEAKPGILVPFDSVNEDGDTYTSLELTNDIPKDYVYYPVWIFEDENENIQTTDIYELNWIDDLENPRIPIFTRIAEADPEVFRLLSKEKLDILPGSVSTLLSDFEKIKMYLQVKGYVEEDIKNIF